jgi:hypothetical protein
MYEFNTTVANYVISTANNGTVTVQGMVYRTIPHCSRTPLNSNYSYQQGARWNAPGTLPVLYTSGSVAGARAYVAWEEAFSGVALADWAPEDQPDLLVLSIEASFADLATDSGLRYYGLPSAYPVGYLGSEMWTVTQPIGAAIAAAGWPGLVTRSATVSDWSGPIHQWAEVAIFTNQTSVPGLVQRIDYNDWYRP